MHTPLVVRTQPKKHRNLAELPPGRIELPTLRCPRSDASDHTRYETHVIANYTTEAAIAYPVSVIA